MAEVPDPPEQDEFPEPPEADEGLSGKATVNALRSFGSALGGWARKVGSLIGEVSSGQPSIPEELRAPLQAARALRLRGQFAEALLRLDKIAEPHAYVTLSRALTLVAQGIVEDAGVAELGELIAPFEGKRRAGPAFVPLVTAARALVRGEPDEALDTLRRGHKSLEGQPTALGDEMRFYAHLIGTMAHARRGRNDRALLELHQTRMAMPEDVGPTLRRHVLLEGVSVLLAEDHLDEAAAWLQTLTREEEGGEEEVVLDPRAVAMGRTARAWLARTLAARGDAEAAHALLEDLPDEPAWYETRIRVALSLSHGSSAPPVELRQLALRHLQANPASWSRQRLWALCELARGDEDVALPEATRAAIVEALVQAVSAAPPGLRDRYLHELAHAALRTERLELESSALTLLGKRLEADPDTAPEELHLARTRALLRAEDPGAGARFLPGPSPQYRAGPALGGPYGPDEVSPLRDPDTREATLLSQISLATAEYLLSERTPGEASDFDRMSAAQEHLVAALSTAPQLARARALLTSLSAPLAGTRLEDFLTTATTVLAAIPGHVLGVPLAGVQEALSGVIAARERLARPLTIAIMGEFSSGKSTFVNALLGEAIAPMGVLPTTSTINLFRRGPGGGARIHYRDGSIATLARGEVQRFLHGLDDVEASRIRHTEIERTGKHMGDAAVVDTPGLNALDGFHERVARDFIDESDAVVWIFSATRGGAASEAGLLNSMRADGRKVLGVVNKVDTLDDGEKEELCEYLQEQLGDVLADVIPVCASAALERRIAHADGGEDPDDLFAPVEHALEEHFLKHARELKRAVTIRRLQESLQKGKGAVLTAVDVLAARAEAAAREDDDDASAAARRLAAFADKVHALVLELDDVLTRELLSLGLVRKGGARKTMTVQDDAYLGAVLRDQALRALQAAIGELSREEDTPAALTEVLGRHLIPWARGYLDGLDATRFVTGLVRDHGEAIERGEQALRERLRTCMTPIAASWQRFARGLERELRQATIQGRRHAAARPRAEVLRLKTTTVASIDALLAGLDSIA